jgi:type I restriction enzyme S subunit
MAKKIPNIRFKGFEGDWKEKQLKDAVSYHSTGVRACDAVNSGSYKLYDANGEIGKIDSVASTSPYVSIIKDGSGVGRVRMMSEMTNVLGTMGCITAKDDTDINFIFSHLQTKDFNNHIISGAIPHVYFRDYGEDLLYAPLFNEQQKIGEFFQQLDELIGAKEQELEKLRQMKLALLDKMFPNEEEIAPPPSALRDSQKNG